MSKCLSCFLQEKHWPKIELFWNCSHLIPETGLSFCLVSRAVCAQVMSKNFVFEDGATIVFVGVT